jgi:acyl transferase domain-containing protein
MRQVLVSGSNLILTPDTSMALSRMSFLSRDSRCYSFDHRANGYSRGEGVAVVVLKRLSDALQHNDNVRAIIRGTGSNQDGRTPGLTQPSARLQERLIRQVYRDAELDLSSTRYVEAHGESVLRHSFRGPFTWGAFLTTVSGTGTPLGDPIELKALGRVFRTRRSQESPLYM